MKITDLLSLDVDLEDHLTTELQAVAQGALATGNPGALTLTLQVLPIGDGEIQIEPTLKRKQPHRTARIWSVKIKDGVIQRPRQGDLFSGSKG